MELDNEDQEELMKFETVQTKQEIEFDKIKLSDVCTQFIIMLNSLASRMSIEESLCLDIDTHLLSKTGTAS